MMDWALIPALFAAALMTAFGVACAVRPSSIALVGVTYDSPLGASEIRCVFGAMFIALGLACLVLRQPVVFAVVGAAWLADAAVRVVAIFVDRVPARDGLTVLAIGTTMGVALASGYWAA